MKETRDRIIEAAIKLFAEKGFDGTSTEEISKLAGVNKAMIYYYFSSKEGLLLSIVRKSVEEFSSIIEGIDILRFEDLKDVIECIVREAINYIDSNNLVIKIILKENLNTLLWETSVIGMVGSVFDKVKLMLKKRFYSAIDLTIVEQMLFINLIIGYLNFGLLQSSTDKEVKEIIKERYIKKVSRMIYLLVTDKED